MTSDGERREMVKHLRGQAEAWRNLMPDIRMSDRRLTDSIHMAFGLNDTNITVHEALDMLADLIDSPTCTMTYKPEWSNDELYPTDAYQCSNCGFVVNEGITEYCPSCGYRVSNYETEPER